MFPRNGGVTDRGTTCSSHIPRQRESRSFRDAHGLQNWYNMFMRWTCEMSPDKHVLDGAALTRRGPQSVHEEDEMFDAEKQRVARSSIVTTGI